MSWERARQLASPIRFQVFVREQRVPAEIELDDMDAPSLHAIAFENEKAIGTGACCTTSIGRMAILKEWRRRGIGAAILKALIDAAERRGDREIALSAQLHAVEFYRTHGFEPVGDVYEEAGIPHQAMVRALA